MLNCVLRVHLIKLNLTQFLLFAVLEDAREIVAPHPILSTFKQQRAVPDFYCDARFGLPIV